MAKKKAAAKKRSAKYNCPICGQYMTFIAIGNRNTPFVDGKCYPKMCFGCFHTPADEIQHYKEDGSIDYVEGPFYDHKHLKTAVELYDNQSCESLLEAKKCVAGVRKKIKEAGVRELNKLKLKRPKAEYEFNEEYEEEVRASYKSEKG